MRTFKLIIAMLMLSSTFNSFGQINPINDLFFQQTYWLQNPNCPLYNCFELSWSPPDSSNDTLLGYIIYRNNELWIFTDGTLVGCSGYSPCNYVDFYDLIPFWITVKAVYNSDSIVSIANDSVFVMDVFIGIDEIEKNEIVLLKNPIAGGENVSLLILDSEGETCRIEIHTLNGQLIKEYEIQQLMGGVINFPTPKMTQGVYMISIQLKGQIFRRKILIE